VETLVDKRVAIAAARKVESDAHATLRHSISRMTVTDTPERIALLEALAPGL
jgi:hypothetical protein